MKKNKKETKTKELFEANIIPLYRDVYRYLIHLGCDVHLAENISQTTMEKAWIHKEKLVSGNYEKQWLFRVSYNEYITCLRSISKEYNYSDNDTILNKADAESIANDALAVIIKNEDLKILKRALELLEPQYSVPIRLRFFGELSHKEIADILGLNYNTTRSVIARGLNKLKTLFIELDR